MDLPTTKIAGRNAVLEALESEQSVDKVYVQTGTHGEVIRRIISAARKRRIPVVQWDRRKMQQFAGAKSQGVAAVLPPVPYVPLDNLIDSLFESGQQPNLLVLDRIQDPHNLGALIRSAETLGSQGMVIGRRETAPLSDTAVKASAGAIFHLPISQVGNLAEAVRFMKASGVWIYATSSHTEKSLWEMDFCRPVAVIIGSEEKGVKPALQKECDDMFRIPQAGKTESLNASVAGGIILAEIHRQRSRQSGPPLS